MVIQCFFIDPLNQQQDNRYTEKIGSKLKLNFIFLKKQFTA